VIRTRLVARTEQSKALQFAADEANVIAESVSAIRREKESY